MLLLVFCAFAKSIPDIAASLSGIWVYLLYAAVLHLAVVALLFAVLRVLRFPDEDRRTVVFPATQKTLAMGLPLAAAFFAHGEITEGLAALPLIFYHMFQLFAGGVLLSRFMRRKEPAPVGHR